MENFYLRVSECEDRGLYWIDCEKSNLGIYSTDHEGFIVRYIENGIIGLNVIKHFDLGQPGFTAKPMKLMEKLPIGMDLSNADSILTFLATKMARYNTK